MSFIERDAPSHELLIPRFTQEEVRKLSNITVSRIDNVREKMENSRYRFDPTDPRMRVAMFLADVEVHITGDPILLAPEHMDPQKHKCLYGLDLLSDYMTAMDNLAGFGSISVLELFLRTKTLYRRFMEDPNPHMSDYLTDGS